MHLFNIFYANFIEKYLSCFSAPFFPGKLFFYGIPLPLLAALYVLKRDVLVCISLASVNKFLHNLEYYL